MRSKLVLSILIAVLCQWSFADDFGTVTVINKPVTSRIEKLVFSCIAGATDGTFISPATTTSKITGHILMAASLSSSASPTSTTGIVQILDDSGRDIFNGILKPDDTGKRMFAPTSLFGASSETVMVDSPISALPDSSINQASFTIEVYYTRFWFSDWFR